MHELENMSQEQRMTRHRLLAVPGRRQQASPTCATSTTAAGPRRVCPHEACGVQEQRHRPIVALVLLAALVCGVAVMLITAPPADVPRVLVISGAGATGVIGAIAVVLALVQRHPCPQVSRRRARNRTPALQVLEADFTAAELAALVQLRTAVRRRRRT